MTTSFRRIARSAALVAPAVIGLSLLGAGPAAALSGTGYNNTLPYDTGCGSGAYVISSKAISGFGTASMVYSPSCGTNWMEWYSPGTNYYVWKSTGVNGSWTTVEKDWGAWSYGRQMYAPGTTVATGSITIAGSTVGWYQNWNVTCSSTCTWTRRD